MSETERVRRRYANRASKGFPAYDPLDPSVYLPAQELERALIRWINVCGLRPVGTKTLLEVGCGVGDQLLRLILLGFSPDRLVGYELLPDRAAVARQRLPSSTQIVCEDAASAKLEEESFDVVLQSTVFTSLLDDAFQEQLAAHMWSLVTPGGGVLWYDFIFNNPRNPDVRGVPVKRIRELFPASSIKIWRLTLAPPLSRKATALHPSFYSLLSHVPLLRTHRLAWIEKPVEDS